MSNIIPINDSFTLPAYLQDVEATNSDLTAHMSMSFPMISIKGKVFTIVKGDERQIVKNPKDPESPATYIPIILAKVSPNKSKAYYAEAFREGAEDVKPTCFSNDGKHPDPSVEHPQCSSCASCKWNAFGTARGDNGAGKGKACSDSIRVAVIPAGGPYTEAYMLRVPPASMKNLGEYGNFLTKRKMPYQAVVTKLHFDAAQATPRLCFQAIGVVDQATYQQVMETSKSEEVTLMLNGAHPAEAPAKEEAKDGFVVEDKSKEGPKDTTPKTVHETADDIISKTIQPKPTTEVKEVKGSTMEEALGNFGFDD